MGLALAGGGPFGAIYEIGALCALEESLAGLDLTDCQGYVGVSAGGIIAASLANGISPRELCRAFIENEGEANDILHPDTLMRPAWGEFARRLALVPALVAQAAWRYLFRRRSLLSAFERLGRALVRAAGQLGGGCQRHLGRQLAGEHVEHLGEILTGRLEVTGEQLGEPYAEAVPE